MVYFVDDDPYVRRGFELLFHSAGLSYHSLGSAEEFLEIYTPAADDFLILDMHMPGLDGCGLLQILKNRQAEVSVIIITAYDDPASRECARNHGALAYFRKPVDSNALLDIILYHSIPA